VKNEGESREEYERMKRRKEGTRKDWGE